VTTYYHGTLREFVPSILRTGIRAGHGWGGAARPGVFLSASPEAALYWSKMSLLKKLGLPQKESNFDALDESELVILRVDVPPEGMESVVPRRTPFSRPGDMQHEGSVPPEWITLLRM
jgi:hypothetical protein